MKGGGWRKGCNSASNSVLVAIFAVFFFGDEEARMKGRDGGGTARGGGEEARRKGRDGGSAASKICPFSPVPVF